MEPTPAIQAAQDLLLVCATVLAVGSITGFFARKVGVPDIVFFLVIGMAMGPAVTGIVDIKVDSTVNQLLLLFGASYILFDGGVSLRFKVLKEVWVTILVIATLGVVITAGIAGVTAYFALGIPFIVALLLGCVIASTDPATLVPIFKQVKIKDRVVQTVISESAFNDAMGAILTFAVLAVAVEGIESFNPLDAGLDLLRESFVGIFAGIVVGYGAVLLMAHKRFGFLRDYLPLVTIMLVIGAYLGALKFHGSGFMAVFVAGLILGNKEDFGLTLSHEENHKVEEFIGTTGLIMRMFIFILLGSQVNFDLLAQYWVGGLVVVVVFMFIARPLTVFICAGADRRALWSKNEMLFMCWTRETGVIPAALAGMLVGAKAPGADIVASVTFMAALLTILIQAPTTKWWAKKLGLLVEDSPAAPKDTAPAAAPAATHGH
ncbi:MAG: cation:proton antiporter [Rhodospirillaceae bacterium]|nr:cation:proton antiporter [Rhodospirillaceae bacterium]